MEFEEYQKEGIVSGLPTTEKEKYLRWHQEAYLDDLSVAEKIVLVSPRWSIISGYYGMHDLTKLYLAKHHDLKISGRGAHLAVIVALKHVLSTGEVKEEAIRLLTEAEKTYEVFSSHLKEKVIPVILSKGREEREKSQYYSDRQEQLVLTKALEFQEKIVLPFIRLMERML